MNIDKLLEEVYEHEPSLKEKETELKKAIKVLMEGKPEIDVNENYRLELRRKLLEKFGEQEDSFFVLWWRNWGKQFSFGTGGVALGILLMIPFLNSGSKSYDLGESNSIATSQMALADQNFKKEMAFDGEDSIEAMKMAPQAGGGRAFVEMEESSMFYPGEIQEKFIYEGEINVTEETLLGYIPQKEKGFNIPQFLTSGLTNRFNLNKLENLEVESFHLSENKEFGYSLHYDAKRNSFSLNSNTKWPTPENTCIDEACFNRYRLRIEDIPPDEALIEVTDQFLNEYGISSQNYENPIVQSDWKNSYEQAFDKEHFFIPPFIGVLYPMLFQGKPVYERGGHAAGMYVNVDIRQRKVTSVSEIIPEEYEALSLEGLTDEKLIKDLLENAGYPRDEFLGEIETKERYLDSPQEIFVKVWDFSEGENQEYLVPGLLFKVKNAEQKNSYRQNIVIPLAKKFLRLDRYFPERALRSFAP